MAINLNNPYGMVGIQPNIGTITPPPTPAPTIPGFTGFGDRLATIGGFGDDPDELKTQEELAKMTQAQIDQYTKQRKGARRSGVSEALIQFGEALQGKPATENALKRKQALQNMEMQKQYQAEYQAAIQAAEQTNPAQARLLRSLGLPGFVNLQQKRAEQMFLGSDKPGASKRLSVFDPKTGKPIATILETDFKGIDEAAAKGYIVAPLSAPQGPGEDKSTEFERIMADYNKLIGIPKENQTDLDKSNIAIYENKLFGNPNVIPLFNSEGIVVESITTRDLQKNPGIIKEKEKAGLFTIGQKPSISVKGKQSTFAKVQDNYLGAKKQLDTINDLANIIEQNKDAFTMAGGLANFVNTAKYQVQSVERLANLTKLKTSSPEEYKKLDNMLDSEYGNILDGISENRAVAKSIFLRLAYGTAKEIDPSGRLSDNDVKIAMDIVGNLGANWKSNLATLENLSKTTSREYMDVYNIRVKDIENDQERLQADQYGTLPQFLDGMDWRQTGATTSTPASSTAIENLLNKYGG